MLRQTLIRTTTFYRSTLLKPSITLLRLQSTIPSSTSSSTTPQPQPKTQPNPTSFANRTRSLNDSPLVIHNKKYNDSGKLLTLNIAQNAIVKLKQLAKEESNPNIALRINVESGGCHGFQYNLHLSDMNTVTDEDCIFEKDSAKVIIDDSSLNILQESTVDYTTELIGSMFKVVNSPYTSSSCGCGSSFDVDFEKIEGN